MKISNFGSGIAFLTLTFGSQAAYAQPDQTLQGMVATPKPPRVRATEPGKQITQDLLDFAESLNTWTNYMEGQKWIYGARIGYFGANEWARETALLKMRLAGISLKIVNLSVDKIEGETASATVTYSFKAPNGLQGLQALQPKETELLTRERVETLQLKLSPLLPKQERIWQIVPPETPPEDVETMDFEKELQGLLARVSFILAQKATLKVIDVKSNVSMSKIKQLALGVMQFVQDYDERYAFAPEYLQEAVLPYVKNKEMFFLPGSQEIYGFNENLSDKTFAQVNEPSKTVLFYEGTDEKPTFRYDGKAAIGFADGHVVLMTPEETKTLIWKP